MRDQISTRRVTARSPRIPALLAVATCGLALGGLTESVRGQCEDSCVYIHTYIGEASNDNFGWVSAPIGDVDGDGATEIIVTAPFNDGNGGNAGRVYVYDGRTGVELWRADGPNAGNQLGYSARPAGDVNNDDTPDVIVGAPAGGDGRAIVFSGSDGTIIHTINGINVGQRFGSSVVGVGDINGDDHDDLAVGADGDDVVANNAGRVYVISGIDGSTVLREYAGTEISDAFGNAIGNVGDVTGDGIAELVVGIPGAGALSKGEAKVYNLATDTEMYTLEPGATGSAFGTFFVSTAGDTNNDSWPDVYVSDFGDSTGGRAYVFDGPTGAPLLTLTADGPSDGFGIGRDCGDVNGDGHDDLLMCGWTYDGGAFNAGRGRVFSGADGTVIRTWTSNVSGEGFGFDAHGVGDIDDDGKIDFFITAAYNGEVGFRAGKCYLISGGLTLQAPNPGTAGETSDLLVNGAIPGNNVFYGYGTSLGSTPIPFCPGVSVGLRNPVQIGSALVDALGNATLSAFIPSGALGRTVFLQSLERETCHTSNVVAHTVQ